MRKENIKAFKSTFSKFNMENTSQYNPATRKGLRDIAMQTIYSLFLDLEEKKKIISPRDLNRACFKNGHRGELIERYFRNVEQTLVQRKLARADPDLFQDLQGNIITRENEDCVHRTIKSFEEMVNYAEQEVKEALEARDYANNPLSHMEFIDS